MPSERPVTVFETVSRRWELLDLLATGPTDKSTMVEALDVSRSTINRAIAELDDLGLVEKTPSGYRATPTGRTALRVYTNTIATLEGLLEAEPLVSRFPRWFQPSLALFSEADVVLPGEDRHRPVRVLVDHITDARSIRVVHGPARFDLPTAAREWLLSPETSARFVFSEAAGQFLDAYHRPDIRRAAAEGGVEFRVIGDTFPVSVYLLENDDERTVVLSVVDEDGSVLGLVVNDRPSSVAWATSLFEEYWDRARRSQLAE